jgi:hypothetical protein
MDPALMEALRAVKATEGIPVAVQIDFAVREWLKKKGVQIKSDRKRAGTRKRT